LGQLDRIEPNLKKMENMIEEMNNLTNRVLDSTKDTSKDLFFISLPFVMGFSISYGFVNNVTGDLYFLIAFLIAGIATFVMSWNSEERRMELLHDSFKSIVDECSVFKTWTSETELTIQEYDDMYDTIELKIKKFNQLSKK